MGNIKLLKMENYERFISKLLETKHVYGPAKQNKRIGYQRIDSISDLALDCIIPDMSAKSFIFPKIEKLFSYTKSKDDVTVQDVDLDAIPERVILGVRPCDASGIESIRSIFEWDPVDPIFEMRRKRTTVVSYACTKSDDYCFCTSINGSPGNTFGTDMLLTPMDNGDYIAEIVTPKGEALVSISPELFEDGSGLDKTKYLANVPKRFDDSVLEQKINAAFDTDVFDRYAMRCIGCAACAFVCPTCACFDIQDETRGAEGQRIRSWDTCGSKLFTLHTSGHNPRETQGARWRQRLMHKFSYMPQRLEIRGCVGCGRCSRRCPVDMNIAESLAIIANQ